MRSNNIRSSASPRTFPASTTDARWYKQNPMRALLGGLCALVMTSCALEGALYVERDAGSNDASDVDAALVDASLDAMPDAEPQGNAELSTEQLPYDFGDVTVGQQSALLQVVVRNTGSDVSGTLSVDLVGVHPDDFLVVAAGVSDCEGIVLDPDATCVAQVRFKPLTADALDATLEVSSSPGGMAQVALSGQGLSPGALEITSGATMDFLTQEIQSSSVIQTVTVHNTGGSPSASLTVTLGDPTNYTKLGDTCGGSPLGADGTCDVQVRFNPSVVGSLPTQLSVRESPTMGVSASASGTGTARLQVTRTGTGTIESSPSGISCATGCSTTTVSFGQTPISLTATAGSGYRFGSWSGACSGVSSSMCSVALTAPLTTTGATFIQVFPLDVSTTGAGAVTTSPSGVSCGNGLTDCAETFDTGTSVILTATPDANYEVYSWTGAAGCTAGMRMCSVLMTQARSVAVEFRRQYTVTVVPGGSGSGTVTGGSINCPGTCSATLFQGAGITLTEAPGTAATGSQHIFGGWGGACTGSATSCPLTMDADKTVDASFVYQHRLSVTIAGTGVGTVTGTSSYSCSTGTCSKYYDTGTPVALTATPGTESSFSAYSGDCTGSTCTPTMSAPKNVTATFPVNTYHVGGAVSGMWTGAGVALRIVASGGINELLSVSTNGTFTFPANLLNAASFTVTVDTNPNQHTCTVSSGVGAIASADYTAVAVSCTGPSVGLALSAPVPFNFNAGTTSYTVNTSVVIQETSVTVTAPTATAITLNGTTPLCQRS